MERILDFIAKETDGKNYKSYKYCFESVDIPKLDYEDKRGIKVNKKGETDKSRSNSKSIQNLAVKISKNRTPLFKFFLDGSRRTYKVDDIAYGKKLYPVIAGQIGVAVCERKDKHTFKPVNLKNPLVVSIPDIANAQTNMGNHDLFFTNLIKKLNEQGVLEKQNLKLSKILPYSSKSIKDDKYEDRGIAKIQDEMIALEQKVVFELVKAKKLNDESFLIKDGSLEYIKSGEARELSVIKSNYDCVVGVSKAFNPEALSNDVKDISRIIAELKLYHRTPAFMYQTERIPDVKFAVWYLRIRNTLSPFDGVLKIEKILVRDIQEEEGLDSDEIDLISANIINERNPVSYGKDNRWAKHLYPVHLTENYIKSKYLSDIHFINLF
ncbi:hypothetical protein [Polaribacter sp. HL-MS24]|uniref:hypothetical protein n=1 Tax=Polaribacter sp. HL-MS24 TaxID=3077735 RepID=UPI002934F1AE|nr:hypothetical protein [Polaribacter sp. HL-MS24]WOC39287.1 hypothetical protein RRF69_06215 [Polaribacter sp. HL-MS24]